MASVMVGALDFVKHDGEVEQGQLPAPQIDRLVIYSDDDLFGKQPVYTLVHVNDGIKKDVICQHPRVIRSRPDR